MSRTIDVGKQPNGVSWYLSDGRALEYVGPDERAHHIVHPGATTVIDGDMIVNSGRRAARLRIKPLERSRLPRIPYGSEPSLVGYNLPAECVDCRRPLGANHMPGCGVERCTNRACVDLDGQLGQRISCPCGGDFGNRLGDEG